MGGKHGIVLTTWKSSLIIIHHPLITIVHWLSIGYPLVIHWLSIGYPLQSPTKPWLWNSHCSLFHRLSPCSAHPPMLDDGINICLAEGLLIRPTGETQINPKNIPNSNNVPWKSQQDCLRRNDVTDNYREKISKVSQDGTPSLSSIYRFSRFSIVKQPFLIPPWL